MFFVFLCLLSAIPNGICARLNGVSLVHRSMLGETRDSTPLALPIRGHLDGIKAMMKGDVYIGRGCRQRGLKRSPHCNNYKVANYGRRAAIELFEKHLLSSPSYLKIYGHCRGAASHATADQVRIVTATSSYVSSDSAIPLRTTGTTRCQLLRTRTSFSTWQNCVRRLITMMGRRLMRTRLREVQDGWDKLSP